MPLAAPEGAEGEKTTPPLPGSLILFYFPLPRMEVKVHHN